ncbi:hypothetical protein [Mesorhizobium sp. L103C131B0]|uniref:hypothetical protein n=1 Tax=Mesorhizobium sp. L103C131B0 TaxID=1287089 RepID=UPI0012DFB089|nr:hypothetical protein [Mesorhizobium sp. L103C131B0]
MLQKRKPGTIFSKTALVAVAVICALILLVFLLGLQLSDPDGHALILPGSGNPPQ